MPSRLDLNRWKDAATATARSGLLRPVGPRAGARIISGLWRTGLTPAAAIAIGAARHPDRDAIIDDEGATTYRELDQRIESIAGALWTAAQGTGRPSRCSAATTAGSSRRSPWAPGSGTRSSSSTPRSPSPSSAASSSGTVLTCSCYDEEYDGIVEASGYDGRRVLAWHESERGRPAHPRLARRGRPRQGTGQPPLVQAHPPDVGHDRPGQGCLARRRPAGRRRERAPPA